jgi:hypothetical protein
MYSLNHQILRPADAWQEPRSALTNAEAHKSANLYLQPIVHIISIFPAQMIAKMTLSLLFENVIATPHAVQFPQKSAEISTFSASPLDRSLKKHPEHVFNNTHPIVLPMLLIAGISLLTVLMFRRRIDQALLTPQNQAHHQQLPQMPAQPRASKSRNE